MDLNSVRPKTKRDDVRFEDVLPMVALPNGKFVTVRIRKGAPILAIRQHWINIIGSKTKKAVEIPKYCIAYDFSKDEVDPKKKCAYCELEDGTRDGISYFVQVIDRDAQENAPRKPKISSAEKKSGIKDPESDSWTPVKWLRLTPKTLENVQKLKEANKHKSKSGSKTYPVDDDEFGCDILIKFDKDAPGKYIVNTGDKCALTDEEKEYLLQDADIERIQRGLGFESYKETKEQVKRMEIVSASEFDSDDDKKKKKKAASDSDSSSDSDNSDSDGGSDSDNSDSDGGSDSDNSGSDGGSDSDSDVKSRSKSKSSSSKKKASSDSDGSDDGGSDSDTSDSDSDSDAKSRSKSKSSSSKKKAASDSDDGSDSDSDNSESDADSDAKSRSKSKSSSSKKKAASDSDGSDSDADVDSDSDAKSKSKSKSSSSKKSSSRSSKKKASSDSDGSDDDIPF